MTIIDNAEKIITTAAGYLGEKGLVLGQDVACRWIVNDDGVSDLIACDEFTRAIGKVTTGPDEAKDWLSNAQLFGAPVTFDPNQTDKITLFVDLVRST